MSCEQKKPDTRPEKTEYEFFMPAMPPLGLIELLERKFKQWRKRQRIAKLLQLDDQILEDLGHSRAELERQLYECLRG